MNRQWLGKVDPAEGGIILRIDTETPLPVRDLTSMLNKLSSLARTRLGRDRALRITMLETGSLIIGLEIAAAISTIATFGMAIRQQMKRTAPTPLALAMAEIINRDDAVRITVEVAGDVIEMTRTDAARIRDYRPPQPRPPALEAPAGKDILVSMSEVFEAAQRIPARREFSHSAGIVHDVAGGQWTLLDAKPGAMLVLRDMRPYKTPMPLLDGRRYDFEGDIIRDADGDMRGFEFTRAILID